MVMCSAEGELLTNLYVGGFLNTNFKINQCQGESLVFSDPAGNILESYTFGADIHTTQADHSWSRTTDGATAWNICLNPTPEAANGADMVDGYSPNPLFNLEAGHYDAVVSVELSVPAGYDIRYTLDGYAPTAASALYTGAINVATRRLFGLWRSIQAGCWHPVSLRPTPFSLVLTHTRFPWFPSVATARKMANGVGGQRRIGPHRILQRGRHVLGRSYRRQQRARQRQQCLRPARL